LREFSGETGRNTFSSEEEIWPAKMGKSEKELTSKKERWSKEKRGGKGGV